jgi:MFS family permease
MFSLTVAGVAIGLAFFLFRPSVCILEEYVPLYLKQIGYSASFIGLAPILGLVTQTVGIPLLSYLADKFRARRLFLFLSVFISIPSTLLFLAAETPEPICGESMGNSTITNITIVTSLNRTDNFTSLPSALPSFSMKTQSDNNGQRLKFYFIFMVLRGIFELSKRLTVTLITVAAMTHLKQDKSKFGYYACWGELGGGLALFLVGMSLYHFQHNVCGDQAPDYVVIFFFAVGFQVLTLGILPFMKFQYLEHRVIDYKEVKKVLTNPHYILILVICCHSGLCSAFQTRWEFWYIEKLGGSSVVMAVGGLLRRPIVAVWFLLSRLIIRRFGELIVIAFSLFIFAGSFFALAFIENAWLVIVFDNFQAASFVLSFASFVVHFSKAGSEASTAFFQGTYINTSLIKKFCERGRVIVIISQM